MEVGKKKPPSSTAKPRNWQKQVASYPEDGGRIFLQILGSLSELHSITIQ
jgi:hypothetical protein